MFSTPYCHFWTSYGDTFSNIIALSKSRVEQWQESQTNLSSIYVLSGIQANLPFDIVITKLDWQTER